MEIVIQGHEDPVVIPGPFEDLKIVCAIHSDLDHMNRVDAMFTQEARCERRKPLIKQDAIHATRFILTRSSSTVAA